MLLVIILHRYLIMTKWWMNCKCSIILLLLVAQRHHPHSRLHHHIWIERILRISAIHTSTIHTTAVHTTIYRKASLHASLYASLHSSLHYFKIASVFTMYHGHVKSPLVGTEGGLRAENSFAVFASSLVHTIAMVLTIGK